MKANVVRTLVIVGAPAFQAVLAVKSANVITAPEALNVRVVVKNANAKPRALVKRVNAIVKNVRCPLLFTYHKYIIFYP